jgi:TetR/AcrR family transcriptional regulator
MKALRRARREARPAARDGDATRERLLDAAGALFSQKGFDGVRLREVAAQAGTTVPLLCFHFRDKESLYAASIDRAVERFASLGWGVLRSAGAFAQRLEGMVHGLIDLIAADAVNTALLHRELADGGARARPIVERWFVPLEHAARDEILAAQRRGEVRRGLDADMVVLHIVAAVVYPAVAAPIVRAIWNGDPLSGRLLERRKSELLALLFAALGVDRRVVRAHAAHARGGRTRRTTAATARASRGTGI